MVDDLSGLAELRRRDAVLLYRLPGLADGTVVDGDGPATPTALIETLRLATQELVTTAQQMFDVSYAGLHIVTPGIRSVLASTDPGLPARISDADSLSAVAMQLTDDSDVVELRDAGRVPTLTANPFVDGQQAAVRFYAAVTLVGREGLALGALCISSGRPRELTRLERVELRHMGYAALHLLDRHRRRAERAGQVSSADKRLGSAR